MNNNLKITSGKWIVAERDMDFKMTIGVEGPCPTINPIAHIYKSRKEFEYNKKAIVAAVNLFKNIGITGEEGIRNQRLDILQSIEDFELEAKEAYSGGGKELGDRLTGQVKSLIGVQQMLEDMSIILVDSFGADEKETLLMDEEE